MLAVVFFKVWVVHYLYTLTAWCVTLPCPETHYSWWRRDVSFVNTEFQSFLSRSTVRYSSECNQICSTTSQCQFATFNNFTREFFLRNGIWPYAHFGNISLNFNQANKFCADFGGHLACPNTYTEMQKIKQLILQKQGVTNYWVGGTRSPSGWKWLDGRPINNNLWSSGEPSGDGICVQLGKDYNYQLNDLSCSYKQQFICEVNHLSDCE